MNYKESYGNSLPRIILTVVGFCLGQFMFSTQLLTLNYLLHILICINQSPLWLQGYFLEIVVKLWMRRDCFHLCFHIEIFGLLLQFYEIHESWLIAFWLHLFYCSHIGSKKNSWKFSVWTWPWCDEALSSAYKELCHSSYYCDPPARASIHSRPSIWLSDRLFHRNFPKDRW